MGSSNLSNVGSEVARLRQSYKDMLALGEGANGADFRMVFEDYPDLTFLIQTAKEPELRRMPIESFGPHGVAFTQQGVLKTTGEMPCTVKAIVSGGDRKFLEEWVLEKKYMRVVIARVSESEPESSVDCTYPLEDCWIECEGGEFSVDDGGVLVKPSFTMHYHYFGNPDGETLSWD